MADHEDPRENDNTSPDWHFNSNRDYYKDSSSNDGSHQDLLKHYTLQSSLSNSEVSLTKAQPSTPDDSDASDSNTSSGQETPNFEISKVFIIFLLSQRHVQDLHRLPPGFLTALASALGEIGGLFKPMNYLIHWGKQVVSSIRQTAENIKKLWDNLSANKKIIVVLVVYGVSAVIFTPAIMSVGLDALGFSAQGPVLGSIAASLQTATTASGSLFAILQSAAMGGYGVNIVSGVIAGAGAGAGAAAGGVLYWLTRGRDKDKRD